MALDSNPFPPHLCFCPGGQGFSGFPQTRPASLDASPLCGTHPFSPDTGAHRATACNTQPTTTNQRTDCATFTNNTPSDANPIFERAHPIHPHLHTHSPTHSQTFTRKPGVLGDSKTPPSMRASHPAKIISLHPRQNNHSIHIPKRLNRAQHNSTTTNKLQHHCTYLEHPKPTPTRS